MPLGLDIPTEETATGAIEESPTSTETEPTTTEESAEPTTDEEPSTSTDTDEAGETTDKATGAEPTPVAAQRKKGKTAEDRIRELVAEREYFKGLAEGRSKPEPVKAEAPVVPKADEPPVRPNVEDFADANEYWEADRKWTMDMAVFTMEQRFKQREEASRQQTQQQAQAEQVQKAIAAHDSRMKKAMETDPGLEDIVKDRTLKVSDAMTAIIVSKEEGPGLIRWLHDHPTESERIYNMAPTIITQDGHHVQRPGTSNPFLVAYEMGGIAKEMALANAAKPRKVSQAPTPHTPVGGKGKTGEADISDLAMSDPDEYLRKVRESEG